MTRTSHLLGALLLGVALAAPAGSNGADDRNGLGKGDISTVGSAPQALTPAELQKIEAARALAPAADRALQQGAAAPPPEKPASISTVRPRTAGIQTPDWAKPSSAAPPEPPALTGPPRPKPPENFTSEPGAPGLTAAETAKLEALRRNGAMQPAPGRSER